MPIEHAKSQLPVVTSGCKLAHMKEGESIFPISVITTGSDDRSYNLAPWIAVELFGSVVTMPIERAKFQLPVVTSGCKLAHKKDGENIFHTSVITTGNDDQKLQFSALNSHWNCWFL